MPWAQILLKRHRCANCMRPDQLSLVLRRLRIEIEYLTAIMHADGRKKSQTDRGSKIESVKADSKQGTKNDPPSKLQCAADPWRQSVQDNGGDVVQSTPDINARDNATESRIVDEPVYGRNVTNKDGTLSFKKHDHWHHIKTMLVGENTKTNMQKRINFVRLIFGAEKGTRPYIGISVLVVREDHVPWQYDQPCYTFELWFEHDSTKVSFKNFKANDPETTSHMQELGIQTDIPEDSDVMCLRLTQDEGHFPLGVNYPHSCSDSKLEQLSLLEESNGATEWRFYTIAHGSVASTLFHVDQVFGTNQIPDALKQFLRGSKLPEAEDVEIPDTYGDLTRFSTSNQYKARYGFGTIFDNLVDRLNAEKSRNETVHAFWIKHPTRQSCHWVSVNLGEAATALSNILKEDNAIQLCDEPFLPDQDGSDLGGIFGTIVHTGMVNHGGTHLVSVQLPDELHNMDASCDTWTRDAPKVPVYLKVNSNPKTTLYRLRAISSLYPDEDRILPPGHDHAGDNGMEDDADREAVEEVEE
ncbi:hypothetical protein GLAREA_07290 [Glarea lozoyensis ATCC 20868]|uniref:Uncharacterized protein n=1 Tax=Glarea lozoyensis (strain ATCC 20868 / MF5171) TaxID=1116229 RepID=S3D0V2_GLAL2|nr:uncharacterized protein GLAREA_07290 [Glarea lozoyensis ATCC 20868]EPE32157.1 hypothetical protein GLAREA_07290 [Glarea lozoyensis ATCC 20868]